MAVVPQRRSSSLPVPPQQPANDPNRLSTEDPTKLDPLSPTTIVLNYLKSKGYQPTAENIRRTIEANARDPGVLGPDMAGYMSPQGQSISLRNAGIEDSAPQSAGKRTSAFPQPVDLNWQTVQPWPQKPDAMQPNPVPPRSLSPPIGEPPPPPMLPGEPAPVGGGPAPQISPPPPAGAAVAQPPPPDPLRDAITRAIGGPPETPALPAPPVRPAIAAPPEVPALPAPSPQLALPAPAAPSAPQIAAPPEIPMPNVAGQSGRPGMRVAPGKQVQGAPIEQTPATRAIPRVAGGVASGAARGGIPGAIAGGVGAAAPEILDLGRYIAKNLHLY